MTTLGPTYFEDKEPSEETAKAAQDAQNNGYRIIYPEVFLRKLDPNNIKPQEQVQIEKDKKIKR